MESGQVPELGKNFSQGLLKAKPTRLCASRLHPIGASCHTSCLPISRQCVTKLILCCRAAKLVYRHLVEYRTAAPSIPESSLSLGKWDLELEALLFYR